MKQLLSQVLLIFVLTGAALMSVTASGNDNIATLRNAPIEIEPDPPSISRTDDSNQKRIRNYPMQPPMIPHKIDGYQVDMNVNQCMACHSRRNVQESRAAMVSVTHYMDRDGNFLASISPRRYFCQQCHVTQTDAQPRVANDFIDIDDLLSEAPAAAH